MTADVNDPAARARRMWGLADYSALADRLAPASEQLATTLPDPPGRVLDLAAGTGTLAVLAAGRGATVDAADLSPRMVELGRDRTHRLAVAWHEMDAEDLAFDDGAFDAVLSSFGMIFAPRPERVLEQVRRVLPPGGRLAFTAWTPAGFMGEMALRMREWLPQPAGAADPGEWGREEVVHGRLAEAGFTDVRVRPTSLPWHFDSGPAMTQFFRAHSPSHHAAAAALGDRADAMFAAIEQLGAPDGGPVRVDAEYLLVTATAAERTGR
ncbi:class I SAM-dependent methyltransferase [Pseudonocardia humida]|uniref:Class I SAM-dependent methyltransferase n=1 Tax=Pseudonocardia humida TaxID=2800819 RepID=A0ABT0ZWM8_9PSEU|nr:class I SAM-dependent methyltransferase [Pseudonocardia humida]MCO1655152.1 class I SAM-dependent methyltransferase [Pseudonocardia humida]